MIVKGFTLIELLVVIVIIGLLAAIGIGSYTGALQRGRDAQRLASIKEIQDALDRYYLDNGRYPSSGGSASPNTGWTNSNDSTNWGILASALEPYLLSLPVDPINPLADNPPSDWPGGGDFTYAYFSGGYGCAERWYMFVHLLETTAKTSPGVIACDGTSFNYAGTQTVGKCPGCN